jgi:hypothetical protein
MKLHLKLTAVALGLAFFLKSQSPAPANFDQDPKINKRGCATQVPSPEWDAWFNKKVEEYKDMRAAGRANIQSLTIPVVVHVIHGGQSVNSFPNISASQIKSQIIVLNKDFAGVGYNSYFLASTGFSAVGAVDTKITFCLAQFDPAGNPMPEPGIDRVNYITNGWTDPASPTTMSGFQSLMDGTIKPGTIWDPYSYFNIWVTDVNTNTGILGYATFPGGSNLTGLPSTGTANNDGIWVWGKCFGNTGTLALPYTLGRTATHETGHWLGLRHIGGDGNGNPNGDCNATDYCNDTPPQTGGNDFGQYGQNYGAPAYPLHVNTCGSQYGDMFMNFMDYTNDAYSYMFTPDQNDRIQTAIQNGWYRNSLNASSAALCVGLPVADFILDSIACVGAAINPVNTTAGTPSPTYSWNVKPSGSAVFSPGSTDPNPNLTFASSGDYTLTLIANNGIGTTSSAMVLHIDNCVGIKANDGQGAIRFAPNPTSGMVTITTSLPSGQNLNVEVRNSLGQVIISEEHRDIGHSNIKLDLSAYPDGVYIMSIGGGQEKTVKRLILSK